MEKEGLLLLVQLDHLTGEDIGWAMQANNLPGIRNRNLISTLTKKGRMGHLLLLDVDPEAEDQVGQFLLNSLTTHGYHRIETRHVHYRTVMRKANVVVKHNDVQFSTGVRLKRDASKPEGPYFLESDDLFALHQQIHEKMNLNIFPLEIRRRIEMMAQEDESDILHIDL
jgi:uncharacterized protein (DUF111 family)